LLKLKAMLDRKDRLFRDAVDVFATKHGLLGLFHLEYSAPVLPEGKVLISPEIVIERDGQRGGRLRLVDPAGEGLELLTRMRNEHQPSTWEPFTEKHHGAVAMPDEVAFARRAVHNPRERFAPIAGGYVPWAEAQTPYKALFVLDPTRVWDTGVSVLPRRESIAEWTLVLRDLPAPPYGEERLPYVTAYLADVVAGVSLAPTIGEDGGVDQGWRCETLLEAAHTMLYLDITRDAKLRECGLHDCSEYFRPGSHNADYCCNRHTSLATTRRYRGREP